MIPNKTKIPNVLFTLQILLYFEEDYSLPPGFKAGSFKTSHFILLAFFLLLFQTMFQNFLNFNENSQHLNFEKILTSNTSTLYDNQNK